MKTKTVGIGTVLSLVFLVSSSFANAQEKLNYFIVKAGMYFPTDEFYDIDYDAGFNGEISVGHYFQPSFCFEGGIGYFETGESYRGFDPIVLGSWSEDDDLSVIPVTLTGKGVFTDGTIEFYVGGGIGLYLASFDADVTSTAIGSGSFSDNDTVFGFHLLMGLNVDISNRTFFGVEWKNLWTEEGNLSDTVLGVPIELEADLNGYMMTANFGFRF